MTGMQQLDQHAGTDYVPRHAWVEPSEPASEPVPYAAPAAAPVAPPRLVFQPYQIVDGAPEGSDSIAIAPDRKRHRWGRRGA